MTQSILITDDHKTHNATSSQHGIPLQDAPQYGNGQPFFPPNDPSERMASFGGRPYHSTTDLAALSQQFQPQYFNGMGLYQTSSMNSQATSATMTPRNLSRQASPTLQTGPNKKRKGSSTHHKIPSGLTMTRADVPQPMTMPSVSNVVPATASAVTSPTGFGSGPAFGTGEAGFAPPLSIPSYGGGPPTPNNNNYMSPAQRNGSFESMQFAQYYSAPSSAHHSRAPSPVANHRAPTSVFSAQQPQMPSSASTMSFPGTTFTSDPQQQQHSQQHSQQQSQQRPPTIFKVLPNEGPVSGGIEVAIFGKGFHRGIEVWFGDSPATTTTYWDEASLVCMLPPSPMPGIVTVAVTSQGRARHPTPPSGGPEQRFKYIDNEPPELLEMFARLMCQQQGVAPDQWRNFARQYINHSANGAGNQWSGGSPYGMMQRGHSDFSTALSDKIKMEELFL
ncbi:hypothetical protein LTS18_012507, partial [Coniosporium uncinatum]